MEIIWKMRKMSKVRFPNLDKMIDIIQRIDDHFEKKDFFHIHEQLNYIVDVRKIGMPF